MSALLSTLPNMLNQLGLGSIIIGGLSKELLSTKTFTLYAVKEFTCGIGGRPGNCGMGGWVNKSSLLRVYSFASLRKLTTSGYSLYALRSSSKWRGAAQFPLLKSIPFIFFAYLFS